MDEGRPSHRVRFGVGSTSRGLPADWLFTREQCWYLYRERRLVLSALGSIQNLTWGTGMHGIAETNTSRFNLFLTFPPGILRAVFSSLLRSPFYKLPDHIEIMGSLAVGWGFWENGGQQHINYQMIEIMHEETSERFRKDNRC